jgi:TPR repeat protein
MKRILPSLALCLALICASVADIPTDTLRRLAEAGDAKAQHKLGHELSANAEAVDWWRKSASQGYAYAFLNLIDMSLNNFPFAPSPEETQKWMGILRKSAEKGNAKMQYCLGKVTKDKIEAAAWYRKAAEQGDEEAAQELSTAYEYGFGVLKNKSEAIKWRIKSAELNSTLSQLVLAQNYELGLGLLKNIVEAHAWYSVASITGEADFQFELGFKGYKRLEDKMTDEQKAEAIKRAHELFAKLPKGK